MVHFAMKLEKNSEKNTKSTALESKSVNLLPTQNSQKGLEALTRKLEPQYQKLIETYIADGNVSIAKACDTVGISKSDVAVALRVDKDFKSAYALARKITDEVELMELERVSTRNALLKQNVTERIFRMKSLNRDRYADKRSNGANVDININFGSGVSSYAKEVKAPSTRRENKNELTEIVGRV
tara:strand:- start:214 stop:765 length:552 start_codon:yes stop_codon:yes gene_type:complete